MCWTAKKYSLESTTLFNLKIATKCLKLRCNFTGGGVDVIRPCQGNKAKCSQDLLVQWLLMEQLRHAWPVARARGPSAHHQDFCPFEMK